jgi:glutathione S-transferase
VTTKEKAKMRLYHSPGTRSTRVAWTLEELNVPYDVTILTVEERRGTEHRKRHLLGRVPVLELDDGQIMFESAGIAIELADLHPEAKLAPPPGSPERAALYQWLFYGMTELEPAGIAWRKANRDGVDTIEPAERLIETASAVDRELKDRPWMLGESFSIVDIIIAKIWEPMLNTPIAEDLPALRAHTELAQQRAAYERAQAIGASPV